jgi:cbb3-type cytochrome oxidase maturation protein
MFSLVVFTGIGFVLFLGSLAGLTWAVRSGQLDDLDTPPLRMLGDDREALTPPVVNSSSAQSTHTRKAP